jgi:NAD(P)H dehydrogenase (quinone)
LATLAIMRAMHILLLHAHPEPRSFTSALRDVARATLHAEGHTVIESDLYAMRFDPVGGPHDVVNRQNVDRFVYQDEQLHASRSGGFAPVVAQELDKLRAADALILTFPLWWFSMPAILKGWVDRICAFGAVYGPGQSYATAPLRGKRALCGVTTGAPAMAFSDGGRNGDFNRVLHHIQFGMLHFIGCDVLPPFGAFGARRADDAARAACLEAWRERVRALPSTPPLLGFTPASGHG